MSFPLDNAGLVKVVPGTWRGARVLWDYDFDREDGTAADLSRYRWSAVTNTGGVKAKQARGRVRAHTAGTDRTTFAAGVDPCPADQVTIFIGIRKTDGTLRASSAFGNNSSTDDHRCGAHVPYSDGVVYWDFGGSAGSNRLSVGSLALGNDLWCFTHGPRGKDIWQNGQLRATSGTSGTRTVFTATHAFGLGQHSSGGGGSDLLEYWLFVGFDKQLSEAAIREFFQDPWAHRRLWAEAPMLVDAGGGQTVPIGLASETDTALPLTSRKGVSVGLASETDSALPLTSHKRLAIGLADETDTALPIGSGAAHPIGLASETGTALPLTANKTHALGLATTLDSALPLSLHKRIPLGLALSTETALPITVLGGAPPKFPGAGRFVRAGMVGAFERAGMTGSFERDGGAA